MILPFGWNRHGERLITGNPEVEVRIFRSAV